jgi:hypothetical protein
MPEKTSEVVEGKRPRSIVVPVRLWARKKGDWIFIRIVAPGQAPVWVTDNPRSKRFQQTLFRNLKETLIARAAWPFEEESETGAGAGKPDLDRELEYFKSSSSRYHPVLAKGGASASEIVLRDRNRF